MSFVTESEQSFPTLKEICHGNPDRIGYLQRIDAVEIDSSAMRAQTRHLLRVKPFLRTSIRAWVRDIRHDWLTNNASTLLRFIMYVLVRRHAFSTCTLHLIRGELNKNKNRRSDHRSRRWRMQFHTPPRAQPCNAIGLCKTNFRSSPDLLRPLRPADSRGFCNLQVADYSSP